MQTPRQCTVHGLNSSPYYPTPETPSHQALPPHLRRHTSSIISAGLPAEADTLQVKDIDFELMRLQLRAPRVSETRAGRTVARCQDFNRAFLRLENPAVLLHGRLWQICPTSSSWPVKPLPSSNSASPALTDLESSMDTYRNRGLESMSMVSTVAPSQAKKVRKMRMYGVLSSVQYLVRHLSDGKVCFGRVCAVGSSRLG